jgi:hypothetical protein
MSSSAVQDGRCVRECPSTVRVAVVIALVFLFACKTTPDVSRPQSYASDGISFDLPRNWSVSADAVAQGKPAYRYVIVESPGSALVIVTVHEPPSDMTLEEFAARFHPKMIEKVEPGAQVGGHTRARTVRAVVAGEPSEGIEQFLSLETAGRAVSQRLRVFEVKTGSATAFLLVQAAAQDWNLFTPAFDLVLKSFAIEEE